MRLRQHTVGYSQSQQVFKVFSSGLHKGTESFSPLVDRFVDNRLFKVSTQCPHICCRCHGNCRWFSTALNLLIENADGLIKCNCFVKIYYRRLCFFDEALPESRRGPFFDSRCGVHQICNIFACALRCYSTVYAMVLCRSVCLSQVRSSIETAVWIDLVLA